MSATAQTQNHKPASKSSSLRKQGSNDIEATDSGFRRNDVKWVLAWLLSVAALVFTMIIVGAITRLTESGLSMVEWRPLIGTLPPLNEAEWQRVFDLYRETPEYQKKNFWMGIEDFKTIFFWEWFHRVLGRIIGLAYAVPLLIFWLKNMIPQGYKLKFFGMLILGGLQGLMGWYMVKSGLIDQPAVSHYRLAAHLSLAFIILSCLVWLILDLLKKSSLHGLSVQSSKTKMDYTHKACNDVYLKSHAFLTLGIITITVIWGAFTAGLDAGLVYNDGFPKMGGQWIPETLIQVSPLWLNLFENPVGVQFTHRWLGIITVLTILSFWLHGMKKGDNYWSLHALAAMAFIQMSLGISTLLSNVQITLATLHQAGAAILLCLMIVNLHRLVSAQAQKSSHLQQA